MVLKNSFPLSNQRGGIGAISLPSRFLKCCKSIARRCSICGLLILPSAIAKISTQHCCQSNGEKPTILPEETLNFFDLFLFTRIQRHPSTPLDNAVFSADCCRTIPL